MKILLIALAVVVVVVYAGICAFLRSNQERMIFFPDHAPMPALEALAKEQGFEPWMNTRGDRIGWKSPGADHSLGGRARDALLICNGNGGFALGRNYARMRRDDASFQIYLLEYPGYGARTGSLSTQAMVSAAIDAIDTLRDDPERRIWLMGQSLGSGVVCAAAVARPKIISGIVLLTPFDSLSAVAGSQFPWLPVRLLLRHRLDSDTNLESYHGPVAFIVAGNDHTIPPKHGRRLYDGYDGPKRLWLIPGADHNDFDQLLADWAAITAWLRANTSETILGR